MASVPYSTLKLILGRGFRDYWSTTQRVYAGFSDPSYELPSAQIWSDLCLNAPQVGYKSNIYDCEDIAMEFKAYVARNQASNPNWQNISDPFAVGIAVGQFSWIDNGNTQHAANFVLLEPADGENPQFAWFDLRLRRAFPFNAIRSGLVWVLI